MSFSDTVLSKNKTLTLTPEYGANVPLGRLRTACRLNCVSNCRFSSSRCDALPNKMPSGITIAARPLLPTYPSYA